jgi:hypothetical protein
MSSHSLTIVRSDDTYQQRCECGDNSGWVPHRWQAEDWGIEHLVLVDRVRAHLRRHNPSLTDQRNWYRKQADLAASEQDRTWWTMLADGLDHRIGHPVVEQPLFEEDA